MGQAPSSAAESTSAGAGAGTPPRRTGTGQPAPAGGAAQLRPPLIRSEELLRGHKTVEISHQGVLYRLQATRQGKLILTK